MSRWAEMHRRISGPGPHRWSERLTGIALLPAASVFALAGLCRAEFYRRGVFHSYRAPVPVLSVGNLTVGGTGKTPVVDYLIKFLLARGRKVAVASRGYGGQGVVGEVGVVSAGGGPILPPEICGDEPYLLAARNPRALVLVAPRRAAGVRLAVERFGADVIVLDDGFQHLAVARDLDIVLLDGRRPFGNGRVLPAGPLREAASALARGHLFILTRCEGDEPPLPPLPGPVLHSNHQLESTGVSLEGEVKPLAELAGKRGVAFAGIADPDGFFTALRRAGLELAETIPLADHIDYDEGLIQRLELAAQQADFLITTEKDGVKLLGKSFSRPCYRVPMRLVFREQGELEKAVLNVLGTPTGGENGNIR